MKSKFRGCAIGALIGDCLGAYFEGGSPNELSTIISYFKKTTGGKNEVVGINEPFTDDTAMARSVAASLVTQRRLDVRDMASRFTIEFFNDPSRGYGMNVVEVFKKLKDTECSDPFRPASQQFQGEGSFGNGGAMRIYPAALYAVNASPKELAEGVTSITKITHSHIDAINGAILQAYAVQLALRDTRDSVDTYEFVQKLREQAAILEADREDTAEGSPQAKRRTRSDVQKTHNSYCGKLDRIKDFLQRETVAVSDVETHLGTDISALGSVPAAIYAFLRASQPIEGIEIDNAFERTIIYAISLGGDTDTIATMAGAIAGAFYGIETIPESWQIVCEGREEAMKYADDLFDMYSPSSASTEAGQETNKNDEQPPGTHEKS